MDLLRFMFNILTPLPTAPSLTDSHRRAEGPFARTILMPMFQAGILGTPITPFSRSPTEFQAHVDLGFLA